MTGLDTPETCTGWWNILRISVHQVGFSLHDYIEVQGQQNKVSRDIVYVVLHRQLTPWILELINILSKFRSYFSQTRFASIFHKGQSFNSDKEIKVFFLWQSFRTHKSSSSSSSGAEPPLIGGFWPSQRHPSTLLYPGHRLTNIWSPFDQGPLWYCPPIYIWVFLLVSWLRGSI